jgi:hypothetical protein
MQMKLLGITNLDLDVIYKRLIKFSIYGRYWRKNWSIMGQPISCSEASRRPTARRVVLSSNIIQFAIPRKVVGQ